MLPIYRWSKNKPSDTKSIPETIINNNVLRNFTATATPVYVQHNVEFFVDSLKLTDWRDMKIDFSTGMYRTAIKTSYFSDDSEGGISSEEKVEHDYKVCRFIYSHKVFSDFHKVIISATRKSWRLLPLIYVQHCFDSENKKSVVIKLERGEKSRKKPNIFHLKSIRRT